MGTKFTQGVVPLTDLKANPGRIVKQVTEVHRPALLTSRGRGVAIGTQDFAANPPGIGLFYRAAYMPENRNPFNMTMSGGLGARGILNDDT